MGKCSQRAQPSLLWKLVAENPEDSKAQRPLVLPAGDEMLFGDLLETWALRSGLCAVAWSSPARSSSVTKGRRRPVPFWVGEAGRGCWEGALRFSSEFDLFWSLFCLTLKQQQLQELLRVAPYASWGALAAASAFTAGLDLCCGRQVEESRCRVPHWSSHPVPVPIPVPIPIPRCAAPSVKQKCAELLPRARDTAVTRTVPSWIFTDKHTRSINVWVGVCVVGNMHRRSVRGHAGLGSGLWF